MLHSYSVNTAGSISGIYIALEIFCLQKIMKNVETLQAQPAKWQG